MPDEKARLGLATTKEIVAELQARVEVSTTVGEAWPLYSTVQGSPQTVATLDFPRCINGNAHGECVLIDGHENRQPSEIGARAESAHIDRWGKRWGIGAARVV